MALKKSRAAVASAPEVEAAAEEVLAKGNAVDAAVAGVFAACATSPGVLLGPVQLLVGGGGAGLRAFDGRVRQPGIGAPRPRGFQKDEEVPDAARVGAPWLPATLSVALATSGTATFKQVIAPALALAKGSPRFDVLSKIAARGPRALEERPLGAELLAVAGRPNSGLLTSDDLSSQRPDVVTAARTKHGARFVIELPWARIDEGMPTTPARAVSVGSVRAVATVDRHGAFAIACWDEGIDGLPLEGVGLRAPLFAEPVLRGQTRVRPGDARPAAGPIALVGSETGPEVAFAAFGAGDAYDVLRGAIRSLLDDERIEAHGEASLVAVMHTKGVASVFR